MAVSFFLANKFRQKTYVLLSAVTILSLSFLSTGLPFRESTVPSAFSVFPLQHNSGIVIRHALPLSFPFYSVVSYRSEPSNPPQTLFMATEYYQIEFLTLQFPQADIRTVVYQNRTWTEPPIVTYSLDWGDYFLYYTFFFALNLVGAIVGYWISRSTHATKFLKDSMKIIIKHVDVVLNRISLGHSAVFYVFLTAVDTVQTLLGFPEYEVGIIARVFIVLFSDWAWLYFPFRIILTFIIVVLVYRYATPQISKKLFVVLSLITFASVIWNLYSLAMWSS